MLQQLETVPFRDFVLQALDFLADEFDHLATVNTDHVVVVLAVIELEDRMPIREIVPGYETGSLELGQDPVDGREADVLARLQQLLVNILRTHVPRLRALEDLENLQARQRDLQAGLTEFFSLLHEQTLSRYDARLLWTSWRPGSMSIRKLTLIFLLSVALGASGGCVYRANIAQGNLIKQEDLDQLEVGMTRSQVRFLLGTPMIDDPFHHDRWDYVYYLKIGRRDATFKRWVSVFFEDEQVARIVEDQELDPNL